MTRSATGPEPGFVVWITGISGAGKTTLASEVCRRLRARHVAAVHVDGDVVREIIGDNLGHSPEERVTNAYRISRFCRFLHDQGTVVVCSTMSLYSEIWEWNRNNITNYFEVYLKIDLETARQRDPKGHYRRVANKEQNHVVGVDIPFAVPTAPHLVLVNDSSDIAAQIEKLIAALPEKVFKR